METNSNSILDTKSGINMSVENLTIDKVIYHALITLNQCPNTEPDITVNNNECECENSVVPNLLIPKVGSTYDQQCCVDDRNMYENLPNCLHFGYHVDCIDYQLTNQTLGFQKQLNKQVTKQFMIVNANRRKRTRYTPEQLDVLVKEYEVNKYASSCRMDELADELQLTRDHIKVWYKNRRIAERSKACTNQ